MATIKLRESCEICASSKVKCTKEKPMCSRCKTRGLNCQYGRSRRSGRASKYAIKSTEPASQPSSDTTAQFSVASCITTGDGRPRNETQPKESGNQRNSSGVPRMSLSPAIEEQLLQGQLSQDLGRDQATPDGYCRRPGNGSRTPLNLDLPTDLFEVDDFTTQSTNMTSSDFATGGHWTTPKHSETQHASSNACCISRALDLMQRLSSEVGSVEGSSSNENHAFGSTSTEKPDISVSIVKSSLCGMIECACAHEDLLMLVSLILGRLIKHCNSSLGEDSDAFKLSAPAALDDLYALQDLVNQLSSRLEKEQQLRVMGSTLASKVFDLRQQIRTSSIEIVQALLRM